MSTVKGVIQTAIDAGGLSNQQAAGLVVGRVHVSTDTVASLAATQTGATDVLELFGDLPSGAKILFISLLQTGTQTSTIAVGTSYNDDEFLAAGSAGIQVADTHLYVPGHQYALGTSALDTQIIVTFAGAVGAAGKLYAECYWTTD